MKTKILIYAKIGFFTLFNFFTSQILFSQIPEDPLEGKYSIAKSSELFLLTSEQSFDRGQVFDFEKSSLSIVPGPMQALSTGYPRDIFIQMWNNLDAVAVDLNGDSKDEIVTIGLEDRSDIGLGIQTRLMVYSVDGLELNLLSAKGLSDHVFSLNDDLETLKLIKGNFIDDAKEEIAVAYRIFTPENVQIIKVAIYEGRNWNMSPALIAENAECKMTYYEEPLADSFNYEIIQNGDGFDISAADFDNDGIDEIVLVNSLESIFSPTPTTGNKEFQYKLWYFDYEDDNLALKKTNLLNFDINNPIDAFQFLYFPYEAIIGSPYYLSRPALVSGNLDEDENQEIIFGFVSSALVDNNPFDQYTYNLWGDISFIQLLDVDENGIVEEITEPQQVGNPFLEQILMTPFPYPPPDRFYSAMNIKCVDFNEDGKDEFVMNSPDSLFIFSYDEEKINKVAGIPCYTNTLFGNNSRFFDIADVNVDTASETWTKEIVYIEYSTKPEEQTENYPGEVYLSVATPELTDGNITGLTEKTTHKIGENMWAGFSLALGDFDGDGLQLGAHTNHQIFSDVTEPKIIINAPPVHYDIIDGMVYDVCFAYNGTSEFVTKYSEENQTENEVQSEIVRDWGVSSNLKTSNKVSAVGIETNFEGKYGEYFKDTDYESNTSKTYLNVQAKLSDWYYITKTDYHMWEYPVYFEHQEVGKVLIVYPEHKKSKWIDGKAVDAKNLFQHHEVGNILSYSKLHHAPNIDNLQFRSDYLELNNLSSGLGWGAAFGNTYWNSFLKKTQFGFSSEVKISAGLSFKIWGCDVESKTEFGIKGNYDQNEVITNKTTVSDGFDVQIEFGSLDYSSGETNYEVQAYTYWSDNGALVIDYIANPIWGHSDRTTWWDEHYTTNPDLAFILPWKFDTEKGILTTSELKRTQTKDLIFSPCFPNPGDTVSIITRVHNFSLKDMNNEFKVKYYLGDPDSDGKKLEVIREGELTDLVTVYGGLKERDELSYISYWVVPTDLEYQPIIYAVIDPENEITEIHENNNKGNAILEVKGLKIPTGIEENDNSESYLQFNFSQNYPNPFSSCTFIYFSLERPELVNIEIFNLFGQKVSTITDERYPSGKHEVKFVPKDLSNGIYFYKITAGEYTETKKMVLLK